MAALLTVIALSYMRRERMQTYIRPKQFAKNEVPVKLGPVKAKKKMRLLAEAFAASDSDLSGAINELLGEAGFLDLQQHRFRQLKPFWLLQHLSRATVLEGWDWRSLPIL